MRSARCNNAALKALAELLHDAQTVDIRGLRSACIGLSKIGGAKCVRMSFAAGCPQVSEDSLRSFHKGCRFIRPECVLTQRQI